MDINKTIEINDLFDFYGTLLTLKQQSIFKDYYFYNISLSEIAENNEVSRQAVRDSLKKSEAQLNRFENELKLIQKYSEQKSIINKLSKKYNSEELSLILKVWEK